MNAVDEYRKERARRGPDVDGLTADAAIAALEAERDALREIERFARMVVDDDVDDSAKGWTMLRDALTEYEGGER